MSDNTSTGLNPNTARVQRHRAKLKAEGCRRLEVIFHSSVIEGIRKVAQRRGIPVSLAIAYALIAYVTGTRHPDDRSESV